MDSASLQRWQIARLKKSVAPMLRYLYRLWDRMNKIGFLPNDPLYLVVYQAYNAVHALSVKLHYMERDGTGKPRRT
jgi:hypothetical protein